MLNQPFIQTGFSHNQKQFHIALNVKGSKETGKIYEVEFKTEENGNEKTEAHQRKTFDEAFSLYAIIGGLKNEQPLTSAKIENAVGVFMTQAHFNHNARKSST